ncbi:MAG: DUF4175 family protein [Bacteroidota bacterium]
MKRENILIVKLNEFTRKYYKNKIIRGALISLGILLSLFLLEVLLEYFSYLPSLARVILVYFYLAVASVCLGYFVVIPLLNYLRIGKALTHEQAARIIGEHFSEIGDKLLNTLQLIDQQDNSTESIELLIASIEQRTKELRPLPFAKVINLRKNLSYLKYTLPPLFILLLLLLIAPAIVSDPTLRLIKYTEKFTPPALFRIVILNKELRAMQQDDFALRIELTGNEIPDEVFVKTGNSTFQMKHESRSKYSYLFKTLQSATRFILLADDKESREYLINVHPKPIILNFDTRLDYPAYTGKQSETLSNIGDLIIPEGTIVKWSLNTRDVTAVKFRMPSGENSWNEPLGKPRSRIPQQSAVNLTEEIQLENKQPNVFTVQKRFMESALYCILQENEFSKKSDSLNYSIRVIKDAYPEISVKEAQDTANTGKVFLQGTIKDDYGFSNMTFFLTGKEQTDSVYKLIKKETIAIDKENLSQVFFYSLDLSLIETKPGDTYSYYIEIWDNDGIRGPKSARTTPLSFEIPSLEKIAWKTDNTAESIEKEMYKSLTESKDISKSLDEIERRMIDQNEVSWKEKKKLDEVIKANEKIQKQVENFQTKNEQNIKYEEQYLKTSERILEKQKQLNELANHLLTDEMKKLIQDMKNLLNQMDKNKLSELMPKMKEMNENLEKELDRNLELFKQIEFERKLEQSTNELKKLAEEQKKLADQTEQKAKSDEDLLQSQKEVEQKFDSINKSLEDLKKLSLEMEKTPDLESTKEDRKLIDEELGRSEDLMKSGKMKKASGSQNKSSQQMKELASKLENMQEENEEETQEEDAAALRQLLQNLNKLSFQQEEIIYRSMMINRNDPKYLELIKDQKSIKDKFGTIEDTLNKISRRQVMMKSIITKEVTFVKENLGVSEKSLVDRMLPAAMAREQYAMTGMNNLALLLDEALRQMNMQMESAKMSSGQKMCKKPGKPGGKKSMNSMRQMQQEMGKRMEKMKQGLNKSKGGKGQDKGEEEGVNKEIAKMVAEQEAIRQALQEYENALKEQGKGGDGNLNKMIDEMEKNEKDILNKMINQETFNRQQGIVTKMLESEKAEQQREKEEKRESIEAKNYLLSNPKGFFEYKTNMDPGKDIINFTPAPLNYYYRNKASEYILKIRK